MSSFLREAKTFIRFSQDPQLKRTKGPPEQSFDSSPSEQTLTPFDPNFLHSPWTHSECLVHMRKLKLSID